MKPETKIDLRSEVYNALVDIAFEYDCKGVNPSKESWQEAMDWFMDRFFEYDGEEEEGGEE